MRGLAWGKPADDDDVFIRLMRMMMTSSSSSRRGIVRTAEEGPPEPIREPNSGY